MQINKTGMRRLSRAYHKTEMCDRYFCKAKHFNPILRQHLSSTIGFTHRPIDSNAASSFLKRIPLRQSELHEITSTGDTEILKSKFI